MKLVAMLSWYDEPDHLLWDTVNDFFPRLGVTDVVAVDGAYALLPGGQGRSAYSQVYTILHAAEVNGINVLLYQPSKPWPGNEVQKRQAMLELSLAITAKSDWVMPWDADWWMDPAWDEDLLELLANTKKDFADLQFTQAKYPDDVGWWWMRQFIRAQRGIHFSTNHYTYVVPGRDPTVVAPRGWDLTQGDKTKLRVWHRPEHRSYERWRQQVDYYDLRDSQGVEK